MIKKKIMESLSLVSGETKQLSIIAGPLILSSLVSMGVSIIDLVMMAWLGPESLAAGAVASDYYSVFFYFFVGIVASVSAIISQARGANNPVQVRKVTHSGFLMVLVSGVFGLLIMWNTDIGLQLIGIDKDIIDTGLPYAQIMGLTFIVMVGVNFLHYFLSAHNKTNAIFNASVFALPINALGNYTLMFGNWGFPNLGLAGAGIASLCAASFMFVFLLVSISRHGYIRQYRLFHRSKLDYTSIKEIFHVGLPIGISNLGEMGVFLLVTVLMGRFGAEAVAAHVVALRMAGVIYAIPMGYAQAATVRVGFVLGARQMDKIFLVMRTALMISITVGVLYFLLITIFRHDISLLFLGSGSIEQEIILQASLFLLILAISQPLDCVGTVGSGILRGFKDTKSTMVYSVIAFWGVSFFGGIVLAFLLGHEGTGLWIGLAAGSILYGILVALRLSFRWRELNWTR